jgi:hypothetical protein
MKPAPMRARGKTMKKYLLQLAFHMLLGVCIQSVRAAEDFSSNPGYLPLEQLFVGNQEPNVEITLSGPVLKMLLQLPAQLDEDDEDLQNVADMLRVVDHIYVRVYEIDEDTAPDMLGLINDTSQTLEAKDWQRIVRVREEDDSNVDIHVKLSADGENLNGLAIMAVEDKPGDETEFVIVNIVGNFNPAYLANIGDQMDIDYLEGVDVP